MIGLKTKTDLQRLVDEGLEESLILDYKASPSLARDSGKPEELCKDVSALANSAGGQLVYGIEEDKTAGKPSKVDDGVTAQSQVLFDPDRLSAPARPSVLALLILLRRSGFKRL